MPWMVCRLCARRRVRGVAVWPEDLPVAGDRSDQEHLPGHVADAVQGLAVNRDSGQQSSCTSPFVRFRRGQNGSSRNMLRCEREFA